MCLLDFFRFSSFYIFFKQKTAYEMRISDWSSDVCSSDLDGDELTKRLQELEIDLRDVSKSDPSGFKLSAEQLDRLRQIRGHEATDERSEEHTSELQSLMRISYAVFCLKKKNNHKPIHIHHRYELIAYLQPTFHNYIKTFIFNTLT